jgi:hypothetical protein
MICVLERVLRESSKRVYMCVQVGENWKCILVQAREMAVEADGSMDGWIDGRGKDDKRNTPGLLQGVDPANWPS